MKLLVVVAALAAAHMCSAQQRPARVGDTLYNNISSDINFPKLGEDILIVDFWATNCVNCLQSMAPVAELLKKFPKGLDFTYVTRQSAEHVERFFKKRPELKNLGIPMITGDSVLSAQFPHASLPYVVWIGKDRIIKAITSSAALTEKNISSLLQRNQLSLPELQTIFDADVS